MKQLGIVSLATLLILLGACTKKEEKSPAAAEKVYVVGTDAAYAPFESEAADKSIVGFDIEVLSAIAEKAGLKLKFVNTPWEGLFIQLENGDRDILISAITITDERKKNMDFSEPYFEAKQLIAVPVTSSKAAKFEDLKKVKVGVQNGTTGDLITQKLLGKTSTNIKRFESTPLALKELENGGVDAVVADNGVIQHFVANNSSKFKTIDDPSFAKEYYGIGVKKGNTELLNKINQGLKAIQTDGTYNKIYEKYFGAKK